MIDTWLGLAVFVVLTRGGDRRGCLRRGAARGARRGRRPPRARPDEHRILVVANETVGGAELLDELRAPRGRQARVVLVVCPALNSPLRHWVSDEDGARAAARRAPRRRASPRCARPGSTRPGEIGDGDPMQAIEDAMRTFRPDELDRLDPSRRAGRTGSSAASSRRRASGSTLPLTHVVVDLELAE